MKIKSQKAWEEDLKARFLNTEIFGNLLPNGHIGINLDSIADCFIDEFRKRLKQIKNK